MELQYLVAPFLPLIAAAVTSRVVAGRVRRDYLLAVAPASAGFAAMCVVGIGWPLMELLHQPPPGAGGPWAGGNSSVVNATISLSVVYGVLGALLGFPIAGIVFVARGRRLGARKGDESNGVKLSK
jgi:hypothetical protein